jgi:predicted Zn-dependent protease
MADSVSVVGSTNALNGGSSVLVLNTNLGGKNYNIVKEAADEWNKALGREAVRIEKGKVSTNPKSGDNINSITTGNIPGSPLGVTYSHIKTTTSPSAGKLTTKEEDIVIEPTNDEDVLKAVALHEIGHALGAEHVSDENAVMNATLETGDNSNVPTKLTQSDISSIKGTGYYVNTYA